MKKIISLVIVATFILSLMVVPEVGYAGGTDFLVAKSFNNEATGAAPEGVTVTGNARIAVTSEGKDKALELSGSKLESGILYTVGTSSNRVNMFFEIEYKKLYSKTTLYIVDEAKKAFTIATVDTNGQIRTSDNRIAGAVRKDRKISVLISYNKKTKEASIHADGKSLTEDRYLGASSPKTIGGFGIKVDGTPEGSCLVDNFAIYGGYKLIKSSDVPKSAYSYDFVEVSSDAAVAEEFVGDTVVTNRTFDETDGRPEFENFVVSRSGNRITIAESVFDGNKYIKFDKRGAKEGWISYGGNSSARYVVAQADFSTEMYTPASQLFFIRDGNATDMFCSVLNLEAGTGKVTTATGLYVCKIEPLKWVNVAIVVDAKNLTYDVYVDKKLVHQNVRLSNRTITAVPMFRTNVRATAGTGTLLMDNVKSYEGKTIRELEETGRKSVIPPESKSIGVLGNMKAFEPYNNNVFSNGQKTKASNYMKVDLENQAIYAHKDDLKQVFGSSVKLTSPHSKDAQYYNVRLTGEASGYICESVDTRLLLFSKSSINLTEKEIDDVRRHMFHDRPSKDKLWEDFEKTSKNQHPRILVNQADIERIKELYKTDPYMKSWGDKAISLATSWLGKEEIYYQSSKDGYSNLGSASQNPFMCLVLAYHLTGNERYIARAWKYAENMCLLEDFNPEITFLDVGELCFQVGLCYDWLYNYITEEQRAFIAKNLYEKGVEMFRKVYFSELNDTGWYVDFYTSAENWGAVTNGGAMCGAMAILEEYPETCLEVIYSGNRCIEYMTGSYYPVGAWQEGVSYWAYALQYLNYTMLSLEKTFGTSYGLHNIPGLDNTGYYGSKITGATGMYTTGDASPGFTNNRHIMSLASRYGDSKLMATRLMEMEKFGFSSSAYEMIYYDPTIATGDVDLSLDSYMLGMETIALREAWFDKTAAFLGAHGGENRRAHGHMDIGSFEIQMAGVRFIHDVGGEDYNAQGGYFNVNRYRFYVSRPEAHNLYIINPELDNLNYYGQDIASAKSKIVVSKPRGAIATIDLSNAYKTWTNSAIRGFMMSDDRRSVTIRDEIDLKGGNNEIYWFIHTDKNVEFIEGNTAIISESGKKIQVTVDCDAPNWWFGMVPSKTMSNVTPTVVTDTNKESQNYKTLAVTVQGVSGKVNISAKVKLYDDTMTDAAPTKLSISEWTIPDGDVTPLPKADMLYIDGAPLKDFNPVIGGYSKLVPNRETKVPEVTVDTTNRYEITQATQFGEDAIVKVYAPDNPSVFRIYRINIYKLEALKDIDGMRRYPVAEVTCIDGYEEKSPPNNVIDQNDGTRWASEGEGQWIMLTLDDVYPIEKVGISWMNGDSRVYKFKLEFSEDGTNWTTVYNGQSESGITGFEYTQTGGKKAKYVRYTGNGNSANLWNSVTEIAVLGNER